LSDKVMPIVSNLISDPVVEERCRDVYPYVPDAAGMP